MATISGLRSVNDNQNNTRKQKRGRVATPYQQTATKALTPAAAATDSYIKPTAVDAQGGGREAGSASLIKALSSMGGELEKHVERTQKKDDDDILLQAEYHMNRIRKEMGDGTVKATQVGEMLPEASHAVVSRITQSMGKKQGKTDFQAVIDAINADDTLTHDTAGRKAYIEEKRQQFLSQNSDPFYQSGIIEGMDGLLAQHESQWQAKTAAYHDDVQKEAMGEHIIEAIISGGDPVAVDTQYDKTSSLDPLVRKEVGVNAYISHAIATNDPSVLDTIPTIFLNADFKRQVKITRTQLNGSIDSKWAANLARQKEAERQDTKQAKREIAQEYIDTGEVDLMALKDNPELMAFGQTMVNTPKAPPLSSAVKARRLESAIINSVMSGEVNNLEEFGFQGVVTEDAMYSLVESIEGINQPEKVALITKMTTILEGMEIMKDSRVVEEMNSIIKPAIDDLMKDPNSEMSKYIVATNLRTQITQRYRNSLRNAFADYYDETGTWARGQAKQALIDDASAKAITYMEQRTLAYSNGSPSTADTPPNDVKRIDYWSLDDGS